MGFSLGKIVKKAKKTVVHNVKNQLSRENLLQDARIAGAATATYFTGGAAAPLLTAQVSKLGAVKSVLGKTGAFGALAAQGATAYAGGNVDYAALGSGFISNYFAPQAGVPETAVQSAEGNVTAAYAPLVGANVAAWILPVSIVAVVGLVGFLVYGRLK